MLWPWNGGASSLRRAAVLLAVEREYRTGAEDPAEVGLHVDQVVGARQ